MSKYVLVSDTTLSHEYSNLPLLRRAMVSLVLDLGSLGLLHYIESICRKRDLDLERVSHHGLPASGEVTPLTAR